jgi:hypothetical protein
MESGSSASRRLIELMGLRESLDYLVRQESGSPLPPPPASPLAVENFFRRLEIVLGEHLGDEDTESLILFYSSPLGKKLVRVQTETMGQFGDIVGAFLRESSGQ